MFKQTNLSRLLISVIVACCTIAVTPSYVLADDHLSPTVTGAKIIQTKTGLPPQLSAVALNNKENLIYLSGYDWFSTPAIGNLLVLDGKTHQVISQVSSPTLNANSIFVDEEDNSLWAFSNNAGSANGTVIQYAGRSLEVLKTVQLPNVGIDAVAYNRKTGKYYVTNFDDATIEVYDKKLNHLKSISGDDNALFIAANENTNRIYVGNYWDVTVTVIDGHTDTIIGNPIPVGTAIAPNDCYKNGESTCTNYDSFSATDGIAVDPVSNRIFVANQNDGTFVTIDGYTQKTITTQLEEGIIVAASLPGLDTSLAVNWDRSTLSLVNEKTGKLIETVQVGAPDSANCLRIQWDGGNCSFYGDAPNGLTVSADNRTIYVIDSGDGTGNSAATDPYVNSKLVILSTKEAEAGNH
jgi:DNA-binding beta-propeller fold protein YncE